MKTSPGTSALLSPWGKIEGFYFNHDYETDNFMYEFKKDLEEVIWSKNQDVNFDSYLRIQSPSKERFFEVLNNLASINENIKVYASSKDDNQVVIEEAEDIDKNMEKNENEKK